MKMEKMIYLVDHHGYTAATSVLFDTDCHLTKEELEKISWSVPGAGRLAVGFQQFKALLIAKGFKVENETNRIPCDIKNFKEIMQIKGATGNY